MILQKSLTLRLTCFFSISAIVVLVTLSCVLNNEINDYFKHEDGHILTNKAYLMKDLIIKTDLDHQFAKITQKIEELEGIAVRVNTPGDGIVMYASDNIRFPASVINGENIREMDLSEKQKKSSYDYRSVRNTSSPNDITDMLIEWEYQGNIYRGMQFRFEFDDPSKSSLIATIALNISHRNGFLTAFKSALIKFTILAALISGALHWFITSQGLLPLKTLSKKAKLVSGQDIKQRMPVDNLPVEISGLSETLNSMLERLEDSFHRLENFSSDIAHELRTPISNLMMQTQVILSQPRTKDEYLMALGSNAEEFQRLSRMIADMLFLAKADNDQLLLATETVHLDREFAELFEFYDALAEDRDIQLVLQGEAEVQGDKLMLRRAFNNLISNAICHSFSGTEIRVNIKEAKNNATIEVVNHGETIPSEILPHLFDRFYRADKARTCSSFEGVGLGLAITQSIAKAHGGNIKATSDDQVTHFTFSVSK